MKAYRRGDENLAFLLRYENVAWYEAGVVRILDRRIYPLKTEFVACHSYQEVAQAIADMVTQSAGPYYAAAMGMALAAWQCRDAADPLGFLTQAAYTLSHARPTTAVRMETVTQGCLRAAEQALAAGRPLDQAIFDYSLAMLEARYRRIAQTAVHLVDFFPKKGLIMTQCFAETIVGAMLREADERGYDIALICPETRPYLQGARLTASVACDQGHEVTVITDNMPGFALGQKDISLFTCAADAITMDGHVVNKVGTFQIAMLAHYYHVPCYVTGAPDRQLPAIDSVTIENRDPEQVLHFMGQRTAMPGVKGWYPAFDITPPEFITAVVTDQGPFSPLRLAEYFDRRDGDDGFLV
ncbi:MAG: s-methyl-5-thioribose-1-phosphate isomerase [Firmicutes bacterium]|nr:s-methyl-5-thioribose-1-phosphate isomerase [Bacillota bacterium]